MTPDFSRLSKSSGHREARLPRTLLGLAGLAATLLALALPAWPELAHQHHFADTRAWLGLPNAADVLSNLAFAAVGAWGCWRWGRLAPSQRAVHGSALLAMVGVVATAAGSALYHWQPDAPGLLADRAGMALAFAGVLGTAATERAGRSVGLATVVATLLFAVVALAASYHGNVTPWAVLQFGGCALLVALACCPPLDAATAVRWGPVLLGYAAAKACEGLDHAVFDATSGWLSGHTLKHLCAAAALVPIVQSLVTHSRHNAAARLFPATGAR